MKVNDEARAKLLQEVNYLTDEELNWKPSEDRWSVRQVLEHLYLMEGGIVQTIQNQLTKGEQHETATKPIERAVDRSTKVEVPDFARPGNTFCTLDELKEKLTASHKVLEQIESTVPKGQLEAKSYPHPVFGDMSLAQYIPFVGYHELRHIEQIQEVKESMKATK
ncbi:DinB family protein [Sporosarcina sp. BI001-red]|uniref:DinB family protein n=1 Tax=Sporosarcina sp. BI001-red TaxID=2282866 RepID=UPI000E2576AB|nr:DinB family protein [Sporosarcina sp. BI001-red]REB05568.1 DinB family protein [Sporosarcina sp. BI001-red]